ncbi:MAG: glycoside hydrolase family 5 protein [Chloroflexota bacterium]
MRYLLIAAALAFSGLAVVRTAAAMMTPPGAGYWHTQGTRVLDENGRTVRLAAVTWYGMESSYWVPGGLDFQKYTSIMDLVKHLGYNTVRIPLSDELVERNPIVTQKVDANPQLKGVHALTVLDDIANYAQRIGLKLILDNHRSAAARPKRVNYLDEPLWYTRQYSQHQWIRDWQKLARRYAHNDAVIGFDLRNEPHTAGPGPWDLHAYLNQGATWGPYQGHENQATDWRLGAEKAADAVLSINPHLLIFVEGLQMYPQVGTLSGVHTYWWGSVLSPVKQYPLRFVVPHQMVYAPHDWGPHKWHMAWFKHMSYASMERVWTRNWAFLLNQSKKYAAPIWLGEFGTCSNRLSCTDAIKSGNQAQWFHYLLRFLHQHPQVGWSFWALNGTNSNDHIAHNGLLNPQWSGVASKRLQADLQTVQ